MTKDESVWETQCRRRFNVPRHQTPPPQGWYELYNFNHKVFRMMFQEGSKDRHASDRPSSYFRLGSGTGSGRVVRIPASATLIV